MGVLESCEGISDTRMSINLDTKLIRSSTRSKYSSEHYYFKESKVRLFGDIFYKKVSNGVTEFVLQANLVNRNAEVANYALKVYEDSAAFMHEKGCKIKITGCIEDPNQIGSKLYLMKYQGKPYEVLLKAIPFNRYEQESFKKGIYELYMLKNIQGESSYVYQDGFVIESGIDKESNDKCLVIVGDYATASLNEMLNHRKMVGSSWTELQFQSFCCQLIKAVSQLHQKNIAHRDIRPHNILYSPEKKVFLLGGYHNAAIMSRTKGIGYNLAGVPYYFPKFLIDIGQREDYSQYYNYSPVQTDTYALGLTIMNALFMDQFMPPEVLADSLRNYEIKWPFLKAIRNMISESPPLLVDVLQALGSSDPRLDESRSIEAMRLGSRPQDEQFVSRKKAVAGGYYAMFMYDQWVQEINEVVNYYELNKSILQLGEIYEQIAGIYAEHHQQEIMQEYFAKAAKVYLQISSSCLTDNRNDEAIKFLEKGIRANRKGYANAPNTDLAYLLNKLAMAHHTKSEYEIARAFQEEALDIIGQFHTTNSLEYAQFLIDSAKIESEFQEFKQAENMLKAGMKIVDRKEDNPDAVKLKSRLLESLGNNYRMKAIERRDRSDVYRKKAEECLLDALQITERTEGTIHPQVGSILLNLGNVYFDKREFDKARKSYQKALIVKQHTLKGRENVEVGQCLTYLANSEKFLKEYDKAIRHYDEAIEVFRKAYGNDHNQNTAVAIGNLGLVYKELGKRGEEKQYLSLAKSILKGLFGEQCPDYQYFDRQMTR